MRSMLKSVLVALVAVLALSTAIVATASASQPQWEVKEGETWKVLETGSTRKITIKQQGIGLLSIPAVKAEIKCENMEVKGTIHTVTPSVPGAGEFETLKYSECAFSRGGCGWISSPEQPNGTILMSNDPGVLVAKEGSIYYEVKENPTAKEFTHILIHKGASEGGGKCGVLPQNETLTGSFLGKLNNATSELELLGEGTLKLSGIYALEYLASDRMEVEGGGAIRAN